MAVRRKLRAHLRHNTGDAAVEFIMTTAMLILIFAVLVTAMVYVTQYYTASYICRRVVRTIEVTGEYNEQTVYELADSLGGGALENMDISISALYCSQQKIQLRDEFTVCLQADYPVTIMALGDQPVQIDLPIRIRLSGRSEVFWK